MQAQMSLNVHHPHVNSTLDDQQAKCNRPLTNQLTCTQLRPGELVKKNAGQCGHSCERVTIHARKTGTLTQHTSHLHTRTSGSGQCDSGRPLEAQATTYMAGPLTQRRRRGQGTAELVRAIGAVCPAVTANVLGQTLAAPARELHIRAHPLRGHRGRRRSGCPHRALRVGTGTTGDRQAPLRHCRPD